MLPMLDWFKSPRRPSRRQLLAAIPVRNPLVRERGRDAGHEPAAYVLRLTAPLRPSRLREVLGGKAAEKSFDLDDLGVFVWHAIDGRRTMEELIRHFAEEKKVTLREAEVAVLAFLKTLAQRNLIALAVEKPSPRPSGSI